LIALLNAKSNRLTITDSGNQLFGVNDWNGHELLEKRFENVEVVNTGIIARLNGKYGFYDFKGNLIIDHHYTIMNELPSGLLEVSSDKPVSNSVIQTVVLNKSAVQLKN
jgi:hypothetical protein